MTVESATYISDLNTSYPAAGDAKSEGDDHLRLLKSTVKTTFPNVTGAVTPTHTQLNYVTGVTSAIQTQLNAKAPTASPTFTGTAIYDGSLGDVVVDSSGARLDFTRGDANYLAATNAAGYFILETGGTGSGKERVRIDALGNFMLNVTTTTPTLDNDRQMVFALTSNTNLRISVRGTDSVVRTVNLTLA